MSYQRLKDKVTVVTGGGSGIGKAMCKAIAMEGANVAVADLNEKSARETCDELSTFHGRYLPIRVDVTLETEVQQMVEQIVATFGRVDILCANAGVSTMNWGVDITEKEWDYNMDVNAKGIFFCCKHIARQMIKQGNGGKIINTASVAGKTGYPLLVHYCASKFAVVGLTMAFADELAPYKINVNAVCPGYVQTSMQERELVWEAKLRGTTVQTLKDKMIDTTPLKRIEKPEDVAKLVVFLASEESDFMTGQSVNICGGIEKH
ncbi:MAG: glucose 1-dehydrogenase [Candidatus Bathyarchaeia archaeon]|jgi:NAD(P)-dependent dehydrogenase (short-subunit alcohol dehydrogenase family)